MFSNPAPAALGAEAAATETRTAAAARRHWFWGCLLRPPCLGSVRATGAWQPQERNEGAVSSVSRAPGRRPLSRARPASPPDSQVKWRIRIQMTFGQLHGPDSSLPTVTGLCWAPGPGSRATGNQGSVDLLSEKTRMALHIILGTRAGPCRLLSQEAPGYTVQYVVM